MLFTAREARTANKLSPVQDRRAVGTARIRGRFAPSIRTWLHPNGAPVAVGSSVAAVTDWSGNGTSITQVTASKQPSKSGKNGVPGFAFDGVNDCLQTGNIDLATTAGITVAWSQIRTLTISGVSWEISTDQNFSTVGAIGFSDANDNAGLKGNVDYSSRSWTAFDSKWYAIAAVLDKSLASGSEVAAYRNGAQPTYTGSANANNTNNFGNVPLFVGSRNNGAAFPFQGNIGHVILIKRALTAAEAAELSILLREATGIA